MAHLKGDGMAVRDRWISLIFGVATGARATRTLLTPIGVVIFGVFTSLFVLLAILVDGLLDLPPLLPDSARLVVSIPVVAVGVAVTTWSAVPFLKAKGTPVPFNPPPTLVTTAPYRFARNPMVTGVILILIGIGFAVRSVSLVFVFVPLYTLVNIWELRQIEEPELLGRFGDEYLEYRQRTPMFIPKLKRRTGPLTDGPGEHQD